MVGSFGPLGGGRKHITKYTGSHFCRGEGTKHIQEFFLVRGGDVSLNIVQRYIYSNKQDQIQMNLPMVVNYDCHEKNTAKYSKKFST